MSDDEVIDYEENLKEKLSEEKLISDRLKDAEQKFDIIQKVWAALDSDRSAALETFLKAKQKQSPTVRKRIVVGNTSQFISEKYREVHDSYTHKWMVYVRGPKEEPDISTYVKKVRIFIHPSFAPNDIVDVHHPPFHLSRRGYGEFQVIVQLHFKGNTDINKPIDIVHHLCLDKNNTGKVHNSTETIADIELDKQALNEMDTSIDQESDKKKKKKLSIESDEEDNDDVVHIKPVKGSKSKQKPGASNDMSPSKKKRKPNPSTTEEPSADTDFPNIPDMPFPPFSSVPEIEYKVTILRDLTPEEQAVKEAAENFPPIGDSFIKLPYLFAKSESQYLDWTVGKRKSSERLRALEIKRNILKGNPLFNLSTSQVMRTCRSLGLTPIVTQQDSGVEDTPKKKFEEIDDTDPRFCKYCGSHHQPYSDFFHLQDRCRKRMKIPSFSYMCQLNSCKYPLDTVISGEDLSQEECAVCRSAEPIQSDKTICDDSELRFIDSIMEDCGFSLDGDDGTQHIFFTLFKKFAHSLLSHANAMYKEQAENESAKESEGKVVVPFHLYQAIIQCDQLSFLRNNLKTTKPSEIFKKKK